MPTALRTPRINNNDDLVLFSRILSQPGTAVRTGDPVAEIETDKATFTVEANEDGYVLAFVQRAGEMIPVGSVLAWMGASLDEALPSPTEVAPEPLVDRDPTLKATILLARFGLTAADVPASGARLTAQDVLSFVQSRKLAIPAQRGSLEAEEIPAQLLPPGESSELTPAQRAMLKSVLWHRQHAVPGYVEIGYDPAVWEKYAKHFQREHNLLLSPMLPLMAWHLVRLVRNNPVLNSTINGGRRHQYNTVNLGFTLQSETQLSLLCVRDAGGLDAKPFVDRLTSLMRRGMRNKLNPEETTDVTVSFTSMSRWQVKRHIPVLPPYTSLIVAQADDGAGVAVLGATYDHRLVTGGDIAELLRSLSVPPMTYCL